MTHVSGILLAGGASRRFGGAKLLHPYRGEPMVLSAARAFLDAGLDEVLLVVGAHAAVADAVAGTGVRVVVNARWESGMFSSVRAGLAAVDPVSDLVLLSPADLPQLTADTVARVVAGAVEAGDEGLSVPTCEGRRGHPLALPAEIAEEILSWPEHARLDQALDGRWPVHALPGFGPEVLRDVDTRADAAAFAEAAS